MLDAMMDMGAQPDEQQERDEAGLAAYAETFGVTDMSQLCGWQKDELHAWYESLDNEAYEERERMAAEAQRYTSLADMEYYRQGGV